MGRNSTFFLGYLFGCSVMLMVVDLSFSELRNVKEPIRSPGPQ